MVVSVMQISVTVMEITFVRVEVASRYDVTYQLIEMDYLHFMQTSGKVYMLDRK